MEYLPDDPNEEDPKVKEKTEKKLKEFREYIVDKGVVLMFVKVLLSLKYAENKPRNPIKIIRDYFGKYHDPRWDEMSALKEKIILYNNENAKLLEKAMNLEDELKNLKRTKRIDKLFNTFELDKNGLIGTKLIIELLEYSTEEIHSGENFHMIKCKKRSDEKNINLASYIFFSVSAFIMLITIFKFHSIYKKKYFQNKLKLAGEDINQDFENESIDEPLKIPDKENKKEEFSILYVVFKIIGINLMIIYFIVNINNIFN